MNIRFRYLSLLLICFALVLSGCSALEKQRLPQQMQNEVTLWMNSIAGLMAKTNGMMNAAIARRVAVKPVFIGLPFAIAEPAYAASATGGVISATIPK